MTKKDKDDKGNKDHKDDKVVNYNIMKDRFVGHVIDDESEVVYLHYDNYLSLKYKLCKMSNFFTNKLR